ncbi:MAG TPA: hemerythrin domain-containing protein [Terriglobales bacterium]|nr:hemerythrin domain-containing protein [Terriglobales bacterium]
MPVQIGARSPDFSDPTALMSDCHRRIEIFLGTLVAVSRLEGGPLDSEQTRALEAALKYFREAGPKHTADEEVSLFPRLRTMAAEEVRTALAQVEDLEQDHRRAERLHAQVESLGQNWLRDRHLSRKDAQQFSSAVADLASIYGKHIEIEDKEIFPVASRVLSNEMKEEIGKEMASRRSVAPRDDSSQVAPTAL